MVVSSLVNSAVRYAGCCRTSALPSSASASVKYDLGGRLLRCERDICIKHHATKGSAKLLHSNIQLLCACDLALCYYLGWSM